MLNKSIRLSKEDVVGLNEIIDNDPRIEKGHSEALYYVFKDAADNLPPSWSEVAKVKFKADRDIEIRPGDYSIIRSFYIEQEDFNTVRDSINRELNLSRPRISFMTRLCILYARIRLRKQGIIQDKKNHVEIEKVNVDGVSLIRKVAELIESSSTEATEKIMRIKRILEE